MSSKLDSTPRPWGLSLKREHLKYGSQQLREGADCLELIVENLMSYDSHELRHLEKIRESLPLSFHLTCGNLAGIDPWPENYWLLVRDLIHRFEPTWVSDHLCFSSMAGGYFHDLLPIPYQESSLEHVVTRTQSRQDYLDRRILVENISQFSRFQSDSMGEAAFMSQLAERSGCGLLIDINNLVVNHYNIGLDIEAYLKTIPRQAIQEIHVAGHARLGDLRFDTHDRAVDNETIKWLAWLLADGLDLSGPIFLEWDQKLSSLFELHSERRRLIRLLGEGVAEG